MSFLEQTDDELARSLLASAEGDQVPDGASDRAHAQFVAAAGALAVGAGLAGAPGTVAAKATATTAKLMFGAKCALLGVLGGSALTFAWLGGPGHGPPASSPSSSSSGAPAIVASAAAAVEPQASSSFQTEPAWPPSSAVAPAPSVVALTDLPTTARLKPSVSTSAPAPATVAEEPSLAAEVSALDAARAALTRSPDAALALLARYRRAFPKGKLGPEAEVLTIEAHAAKGDRTRAKAAAEAFLRDHPAAPQRGRVQDLAAPPPVDDK